ncbi:vacuolar protein sorting protein VPS32 [Acrasis kona]|uniref:Vacuolar protein sorting protein VPS32 n=1 Tax=Acrasis kona TaxID=1008807 RepID=A0AAW2YTS4_9EUKA
MWGKLFGGGKKEITVSKKTEDHTNQTINKMQETQEMLEKRQKLLQKKMQMEEDKAKEFLLKKDKKSALAAIKRKKTYEAQYNRLQQQISNVEQMSMNVENAVTDMETLKTQQLAANTLKQVFKETGGIDKVEDVLDEVRDAMDVANDLGRALSQNIGGGEMIDEDDIEAELSMLEMENDDAQMLGMDSSVKIPKGAPTGGVKLPTAKSPAKKVRSEEEDDLAALEAELNG